MALIKLNLTYEVYVVLHTPLIFSAVKSFPNKNLPYCQSHTNISLFLIVLGILFGDEPKRVVRTGIEPVIPHLDAYSTIGVSDLVRYPTRPLTIYFLISYIL